MKRIVEDKVYEKMMTESQLLNSREVFGPGPYCFARQRYEYLKMIRDTDNRYDFLMQNGFMYEECRKARLIMDDRCREIEVKYRNKNPNNYEIHDDFEGRIKLFEEAAAYARETVYSEYVCDSGFYFRRDVSEFEDKEE